MRKQYLIYTLLGCALVSGLIAYYVVFIQNTQHNFSAEESELGAVETGNQFSEVEVEDEIRKSQTEIEVQSGSPGEDDSNYEFMAWARREAVQPQEMTITKDIKGNLDDQTTVILNIPNSGNCETVISSTRCLYSFVAIFDSAEKIYNCVYADRGYCVHGDL